MIREPAPPLARSRFRALAGALPKKMAPAPNTGVRGAGKSSKTNRLTLLVSTAPVFLPTFFFSRGKPMVHSRYFYFSNRTPRTSTHARARRGRRLPAASRVRVVARRAAALCGAALGALAFAAAAEAQSVREATQDELYFKLEGLILQRVAGDSVPWVFDNGGTENVPGDDTPKSTSDEINDGFEPGARLTVGKDWSDGTGFAVTGFWLNEYSDGTAVSCNGRCELFTGNISVAFDGAEGAEAKHHSQIWGAEANLTFAPRVEMPVLPVEFLFFGGARFVSMSDDLRLTYLDLTGGTFGGRYELATRNRMAGLQFGVTATAQLLPGVRGLLTGATGAMANFVDQRQKIRDLIGTPGETVLRDVDEGTVDVAYLGEVRAALELTLIDGIVLGLGGQFLYFNGVALAGSHIDRSTGPNAGRSIDTGETTWFYGARSYVRWSF